MAESSWLKSKRNLEDVEQMLTVVHLNPGYEKRLRYFLSGICEECPLDLLIKIGSVACEFRRAEMQREAEGN